MKEKPDAFGPRQNHFPRSVDDWLPTRRRSVTADGCIDGANRCANRDAITHRRGGEQFAHARTDGDVWVGTCHVSPPGPNGGQGVRVFQADSWQPMAGPPILYLPAGE